MSNRKIHCNQNKMWTTKDASGIAIIVRSRKHTTISQKFNWGLVANITVAVSEKKIICTMDTRTTNALAFTHTVMPLPIMTNTGRNISRFQPGLTEQSLIRQESGIKQGAAGKCNLTI